MGTAAKGGPWSLSRAPDPSYLLQLRTGALGRSPMSILGLDPVEYRWPAQGVLRPLVQGYLAGQGLQGSSRSGARNAGQQTDQTHSHHSPQAGWGLVGAAPEPGPGTLRGLPGAARGWHCWWWTCRSSPVGKGGCGWQPLAPGMALPLLPEASPASRTPVRRKRGSQGGEWPGWGSPLPLGRPGLTTETSHNLGA